MRIAFLLAASVLLSSADTASAGFKNDECRKIYMAYTSLLTKQGSAQILFENLEGDLEALAKNNADKMIAELKKKYQERLKLLDLNMREINEGNAALKSYCLQE